FLPGAGGGHGGQGIVIVIERDFVNRFAEIFKCRNRHEYIAEALVVGQRGVAALGMFFEPDGNALDAVAAQCSGITDDGIGHLRFITVAGDQLVGADGAVDPVIHAAAHVAVGGAGIVKGLGVGIRAAEQVAVAVLFIEQVIDESADFFGKVAHGF